MSNQNDIILKNLNPAQKEAVLHKEGPLLVFAGAGSGKTRVITNRIANLVLEGGIDPINILAVTFTKKAAQEMSERVSSILLELSSYLSPSTLQKKPTIGTFHSLGANVLRKYGDQVGLERTFTILDATDTQNLIKEIMLEKNYDIKQYSPNSVGWYIQQAKNEAISAAKFPLHYSGFMEDVAAEIYDLYEKRLREINSVDFGDLLFLTVQLFKDNSEILKRYQEFYKYILVDEYQDTNKIQYELVRSLAGEKRNLCVVGDDDQGIYKWRGADIKNIIRFEKDFPGVKVVKLEQNYRSVKNVIDAAVAVIKKNNERVEKSLWTAKEDGEKITIYQANNDLEEAEYVVDEIKKLRSYGRSFSDFAVLYRTNAQSRAIEEALLKRGIPYKLIGGYRFYDRKEIKDILSYLKFLVNPKDTVSFMRIVNTPARKMGSVTVGKLMQIARDIGCEVGTLVVASYWLNHSDLPIKGFDEKVLPEIEKKSSALESFSNIIDLLGSLFFDLGASDPVTAISGILKRIKYVESFNDGSAEAESKKENIEELINVAHAYKGSEAGILEFLERIALLEDTDELEGASGAVVLMTLHSSKGLEFPVVFMIGMEEGLLPHSRSLSDYQELEEERRLCYVGITRAKEQLFMTFAQSRMTHGEIWNSSPSRFLGDIPQELCEYYSSE